MYMRAYVYSCMNMYKYDVYMTVYVYYAYNMYMYLLV